MKTYFLPACLLLVAYFSVTAVAFLPRINWRTGMSTTLDHALITKNGFLKPLIYFFKDNPQYLKDEYLTEFLQDILSSTNDALQQTIDNISPQIKFLNALNEIQSANVEVDSFPLNSSAAAHFDGEQFKQGAKRLERLRQELVTSLLQDDKLQHARNLAGSALHTLQDFYSHSNWIELGNPGPYEVLAKPGKEIPQERIAGHTEATCKNCRPNSSCETNLVSMKLTSGYRSGQDIKKPENMGKCSHGGKMDDSRLKPATGGINKDSTSTSESPHASLHKIAADLATEATSIFLNDIRSTVGDDIFAKFLNLKSENSIVLVIDVSGSMGDEISEVKKVSINFVHKTTEKKGASFTFILVPFSDPEVGPITITSDAQTVIDAVNDLTPSGGGDCPELGMTGLYKALLHCLPESKIYFFSDADAKDEWRENEVISLAKEKMVKINFILTGKCGRRKKRQIQQSAVFPTFRRKRRGIRGQALYQALATQTGGQVLETSKEEVAEVVKVIDPVSSGNSSAGFKEVELLNMKESRAQHFSGVSYFVDIDSTLRSLVVTLTAASSPRLDVRTVKEVTNLVGGSLKLTVSCNGPYTLQVTGSSPLDFTYQLLDVDDLERGTTRRVVGNPLKGQTLLFTLDFVGQEIATVSSLTLVGVNGADLETFNITQGQGFYKNAYFVTFIPSPEKFRLKVTGVDKSGARFQRMKPTLFALGYVKLSQNVNNSNTIFAGKSLKVEVNVKNSGDTQTLYFTASDDLKYFSSISPSQGILGKNDTLVLRLTLLAPSNARYGVTSTITVFVSQNSDFTQVVNFMVFFVTVASKDPDLSPPSCTVIKQTGTCASVYGRPECVSSTWHAHVVFIDAGEGLMSITTRNNPSGTLKVGAFTRGAVNTSVPASFTSNCCNPRVLFAGLDLVGNMGTCSVSLVPDIVSLRAKPNTTAVYLYPGNDTKVPFTLINLGSKGSFSFQVTKAPELISYVIPFSVAFEPNASAAGHVIIKSLGDTKEVQNLTVKAVSQSNNVNVKEVVLFHIKVAVSKYQEPDLSPPSCTVINQTGSCASVYGRPECVWSTWYAHVMFTDVGHGLMSITTRDDRNGTLIVGTFHQGAVNTSIPASFTSDCCNPRVLFVGVDLVGNMGTCSVSLVPDIVSLRAKPNTTAVSLHTGNVTKVPFTLINLGSNGSFSFQVTKAPELISYVIPFSVALETNASTAGQVIIKSLGETSEAQNLTVKAVSHSDNVNVKEMALFHIQVTVWSRKIPHATIPVLKHVRLEAVVPEEHYSMKPGETLEVNFTVTNLASDETFKFQVLSNQTSVHGAVQPSPVSLKPMQSTACLLVLMCDPQTANTVTQIIVTAAPVSHNADVKQLQVFSLIVAVNGRLPSKTEVLEEENKLATWQIIMIAVLFSLLALFLVIVLVYKLKHSSWIPRKPSENNINRGYASIQLQPNKLEKVIYL